MFVSCSDYDALVAKGVADMMKERSEGGFFQRVISVHPFASKARLVPIAPGHDLVELGMEMLSGGSRASALRFLFAPLCILRAILTVRRLARAEKVNIVRASDPYLAGLVGWLAARAAGCAFFVSLHADYERRENCDAFARAPFASAVAGFIQRRAHVLAPISEYLAAKAERAGVDKRRIHVIYHGVDTNLFNGARRVGIRLSLGLPPEARIVLYVNRLSVQKFCWDALQVARAVWNEDAVIVFCGDGPERGEMERCAAKDPRLRNRVFFLGFQPRETIAALAAEADVGLVLLAGLGLIELCATGLPVVVYGMEWQRELVEHEISGLVVPERNQKAAAEAVDFLLSEVALAQSLGKEARRRAQQLFSLEAGIARRIKAYEAALQALPDLFADPNDSVPMARNLRA